MKIEYMKRQVVASCKTCNVTEKYAYPVDDEILEEWMRKHGKH